MKLFAATLLASKSYWKGNNTNQQSSSHRILNFALLATVFVTGSFFYAPTPALASENSSEVSHYFAALPEKLTSSFDFLLPTYAKEKKEVEAKESPVEKEICQDSSNSISLANPEIETFKQTTLCTQFPIAESKVEETISEEELKLRQELQAILEKTPMNAMVEPISKQNKTVAAFLVGISLKESGLGFHAPRKNGKDCYNYWGFKGSVNPTAGGYSCFSSAEQAVEMVGARLQKLVDKKIDTPAEMVVWKCGSSCQGHSKQSVAEWINDVSGYFYKINNS